MRCPVAGVDVTETYDWIDGEYVFGVITTAPSEKPLNNYQMQVMMEWLAEEYGHDGWILESIEEPSSA